MREEGRVATPSGDEPRRNECRLHGGEEREPWGRPFRGIEVVRCDHLGTAYVVEMYLLASSDASPHRSHHIHYVRDGRREIHALDEGLGQAEVDAIWAVMVAAMERGDPPRDHPAEFHGRTEA